MNTTKAIIILIVFTVGLILGYQHFLVNAPTEPELISSEEVESEENETPQDLPYFDPAGGTVEAGKTSDQLCVNFGGTWSSSFQECLGISGEVCMEIGGTWNECASACRNNSEAEVCTMQCVQICDFKGIPVEVM